MKPLEQSILKTLNYFDLLSFPLTQEELFAYLWVPPRMGHEEFAASLRALKGRSNPPAYEVSRQGDRNLPATPALAWQAGVAPHDAGLLAMMQQEFYFLPGRESIIDTRLKGIEETEKKLIKARRAVKFIRSVPFLKAIFVCNSVGAGMAKPESDIDFFIVTEKNRIWIVRFFTNLVLRLFGLRTYGKHEANRICLSFYVDTAHLDLAPWRVLDDDIHFAYWLHMMMPVYDPENYYEKFLKANGWVEKYVPNIRNIANPPHGHLSGQSLRAAPPAGGESPTPPSQGGTRGVLVVESYISRIWKKMWEAMWQGSYGNLIEKEAKKFQTTKMAFSFKEKSKLGENGVVIQDGIIKLHENDTRKIIREKWLENIRNL